MRMLISCSYVHAVATVPEAYPRFEKWGTTFMASAEREPILRV
jgi:hypothetical protein